MSKERRERVRARLDGIGADALLVMKGVNVRYLSGYTGSNGQIIIGSEDVFLTDPRYEEQSAHEAPDLRREIYGTSAKAITESAGMYGTLAAICKELGIRKLGVEAGNVTLAAARSMRNAIAGVELVETNDEIERLREIKDADEIDALRRACGYADTALTALLPQLTEGMTESEVATLLEFEMRRAGSHMLSFETICAFGDSAAEPHHQPTQRQLKRGDLVKLDFGAVHAGYHSDMTRTIAFGEPDPEHAKIYELVRGAQQAGVDAVRAGATNGDVDAATRAYLKEHGHGFGHGTGHGVGLEIHEAPAIRQGGSDPLLAGMVITVEPGIYLPGMCGVRIEDSVVVTADGCDILTRSPKELVKV